jgi:hypothetical protein
MCNVHLELDLVFEPNLKLPFFLNLKKCARTKTIRFINGKNLAPKTSISLRIKIGQSFSLKGKMIQH